MSLVTLIQGACGEMAIPQPSSVYGSTDTQVQQLLALANAEGEDLTARHDWSILSREATFVTVATESQGAMSTIAPNLKFIFNETMWNRSINMPIRGSLDAQLWQQMESGQVTGPFPQYRIRGGTLRFLPIPTAGANIYFEYQTKNWCSDSTGVTERSAWGADTDIGILPEDLMRLGVIWRFLRSKGLAYAEQYNEYERRVTDAIGRDGGKRVLSMTGGRVPPWGVIVPDGNWYQ